MPRSSMLFEVAIVDDSSEVPVSIMVEEYDFEMTFYKLRED